MYKKTMLNKNILISTGATRVYIDPVRYISNASSGKMGFALAHAACDLGAKVTVISGHTCLKFPKNIKYIQALTNEEMLEKVKEYFPKCDIFISAAAIVDFKPKKFFNEKIKKNNTFVLELEQDVDILKYMGELKKDGQLVVGFALETNDLIKNAKEKLKNKNLDLIIANKVEDSIGKDTSEVCIIRKDGTMKNIEKAHKTEIAKHILQEIKGI